MQYNNINKSGTWGESADRINQNFNKTAAELEKAKQASTHAKGLFSTLEDLKKAWPRAQEGDWAVVGDAIPGKIYRYGGEWMDTGQTGGGATVDLNSYAKKDSLENLRESVNNILFVQVVVKDFVRNNGKFYDIIKKQTQESTNYFYTIISIPVGSTSVSLRLPKSTGGGIGVEFRDSQGKALSTFSNTDKDNGTIHKLSIPEGAVSLIVTYVTDEWANTRKYPKFDEVIFRGEQISDKVNGISADVIRIENTVFGTGASSESAITNINRRNGFFYHLIEKAVKENANYFYSEIDIPISSTSVSLRLPKSTGGGIGVEFRDSQGKALSTFSNTDKDNGTVFAIDIPGGASKMIYTYVTDEWANTQKYPKFDRITFYRTSSGVVGDLNMVKEDVSAIKEIVVGSGASSVYITSIKRHNGQYYHLIEKAVKENANYFYSEIDIPISSTSVSLRLPKSTGGGIGVEFRDSQGKALSTFSNTDKDNGTVFAIDIPGGASKMIYTYVTDEWANTQKYPKFDRITFTVKRGIKNEFARIDNEINALKDIVKDIPSSVSTGLCVPTTGVPAYLSEPTGNIQLNDFTLESLYKIYDDLCTSFPQWIKRLTDLGLDESGLPIRQYEVRFQNPWTVVGEAHIIGKPGATNTWTDELYGYKKMLLLSGVHGNEKNNCIAFAQAINDIVRSNDSWAIYIKSSLILCICPCLNPWGFKQRNRTNYNDKDLNRDAASPTQKETIAWKQWIDANKDAVVYLDIHGVDYFSGFFECAATASAEHKKLYGGMAAQFAAVLRESWTKEYGPRNTPRPYLVQSTYSGMTIDYTESIGMKGFIIEQPGDVINNSYNPLPNAHNNFSKSNKMTKDLMINALIYFSANA